MTGGGAIDGMMPMPIMPPTDMFGSPAGGGASPSSLQAVGRIRNVFPETWLWSNATTGYYISIILTLRKLCILVFFVVETTLLANISLHMFISCQLNEMPCCCKIHKNMKFYLLFPWNVYFFTDKMLLGDRAY